MYPSWPARPPARGGSARLAKVADVTGVPGPEGRRSGDAHGADRAGDLPFIGGADDGIGEPGRALASDEAVDADGHLVAGTLRRTQGDENSVADLGTAGRGLEQTRCALDKLNRLIAKRRGDGRPVDGGDLVAVRHLRHRAHRVARRLGDP